MEVYRGFSYRAKYIQINYVFNDYIKLYVSLQLIRTQIKSKYD